MNRRTSPNSPDSPTFANARTRWRSTSVRAPSAYLGEDYLGQRMPSFGLSRRAVKGPATDLSELLRTPPDWSVSGP